MAKMSDAALEARRAYRREYYKKNKDKIKGYQKTYWEKKAKEQENKSSEETTERT